LKSDRDILQLVIIFTLLILLIGVILIRKADTRVWNIKQNDPGIVVLNIADDKVIRQQETMVASYYTYPFHLRHTANGEIYDMYDMTAAHKTLPFGTLIMITNEKNGYMALARINDRGPFIVGRDLDVSLAIAQQLDMVRDGTAKVSINVLYEPE